MIKVVHANDKLSMDGRNPSSVAHLLGDWIPRLRENGVACGVCTLRDSDPGADYLEARGIAVERIGHGKLSPRNLYGIVRVLRAEKANIAHLHGFGASDFGRLAARMLGITNVVHEHAALMQVPAHQKLADRLLSGWTDAAIAVSENVRDFMIEKRAIPADRIEVIENGVDLDRFRPTDRESATAVREKLGVPSDHAVVGSVGRLRPEKGVEFLIRAVPGVVERAPMTTFLIVGDGPQRGWLEALARDLGAENHVRFLGFRSDIPRLLTALDVLVLPSLTEGFPLSLIEGMAVGCAIVTTPVGAVGQVAVDGEHVLFVPVGDSEAIARRILQLIQDPALARRLSEAALQVAGRYGAEASAMKLVDYYRRLLWARGSDGPRGAVERPDAGSGEGAESQTDAHGAREMPESAEAVRAPRVCFLMEGFYPILHGATTQILMLGERLVKRGANVLVVTRRIRPEHPREEILRGLRVVRVWPPVGLHRVGKFLMLPTALWALFWNRSRYDLIVVSDLKVLGALGVLAGKLFRKPCILRAESCGELDITNWLAANRGPHPLLSAVARVIEPLRKRWLRGARGFLSVSSAIAHEFRGSGVPEQQIVHIPNGIDTARFAPVGPERKRQLRQQLSLPEGKLFVYTGRLAEGKGLEWLLEVWRDMAAEQLGTHLVLIGSGQGFAMDIGDRLRCYVQGHGLTERVSFTGAVDNVEEYLQAADCFVLPSESESFSLALAEAMACELPPVATAVGGVVDLITEGESGFLVPYRDSERLRSAMQALLASEALARRIGKKARSKVVSRFDIDQIADRYLALFGQLTGRSET